MGFPGADGPLPAPVLALTGSAGPLARPPAPAFPSPSLLFSGGGPSAECVLDGFQGPRGWAVGTA